MQKILNNNLIIKSSKILFIFLVLIIAYIAFLPNYEKLPELVSISGIINHFVAFFVLSIFLDIGYKLNYKTAFLILFMYGFFIEFVQFFLPNRAFELLDLVVDSSGIIVFYILKMKFYTKKVS